LIMHICVLFSMRKFLKDNALFIAMAIGVLFGFLEEYGWWTLRTPRWVLPSLIFCMLFFTFCKTNPLDLRLHRWHWLVLLFQVVVSLALFFAINPFSPLLAQGIMICVLMPTATAGPIIAGKLGGSILSLTSFTLLSSAATAILVPLFFPFVNPEVHMSFLERFLQLLRHMAPLLLGPFFAAWLLRLSYDAVKRIQHKPERFHLSGVVAQLPFYIWAGTLVILMAQTTLSIFHYEGHWLPIMGLSFGALLTCILQFYVGKKIGERFPSQVHGQDYCDVLVNPAIASSDPRQITRISAGQALGQKNTTLAVWMAATYLNPVSALAPAAYILWQNLFNSWQLSRAAKGHKV